MTAPPVTKHPSALSKPRLLQKIDRNSFPDQPSSQGGMIPATLENFRHVLEAVNVSARFNRIKKRVDVTFPGVEAGRQNRDEIVLAQLTSLMQRNQLSAGNINQYLLTVGDENTYDPVADWIDSKPWDGTSRLDAICNTITTDAAYSTQFRDVLIRKWLLSIVAATFPRKGFRTRGVLTLQGAQGIGKTTWIANLITPERLRDDVVKLGHSWDRGHKDARLAAIRHRIVELGELEGSLRGEMASLKAFLTETTDKIRPPYGRVEAEYPRSTIFAASVNDREFLRDPTGNSRFWTVEVDTIDYDHGIDMQQVFAELKVAYQEGGQWWLNAFEEKALAEINRQHRALSVVAAQLEAALDLDRQGEPDLPRLTAKEVLAEVGFDNPTNPEFKEANATLRTLLGEPTISSKVRRWRIPWRQDESAELSPENIY